MLWPIRSEGALPCSSVSTNLNPNHHPWSSLGVVETLYDDANDIVPAPLLAEVVETSEEFEPLEQSAKMVNTVIHVIAWTYLMPSLCLDNVPTISKYP